MFFCTTSCIDVVSRGVVCNIYKKKTYNSTLCIVIMSKF